MLRGYCTWVKVASVWLQVERVVTIMQNPRQYKIPDWFLNRQKDIRDGKYSQVWKIELNWNLIFKGFYRRVSFDVVICVLDPCQQSWEQAPWWFGKVKEDPCSSWAPSLLGVCFDLSFVDINMTIAHRGSSGTNTTQSSIGHFGYLKIPTWLVGGIKQKKSQRGWGMNNY